MKSFILKNRPLIINFTTFSLLLVLVINFYFLFEITPQSNDECYWRLKEINGEKELHFDLVKFEGVTWQAGIRDNDILKEINGISVSNGMKAQIILNSLKSGEYAEYKIERDGYEFTTKVYIKKLINFGALGLLLLAFFWLLAGHIVVMARPEGKVQLKFYLIGIFAVLLSLTNLTTGTIGQNPLFDKLWLLILADVLYTIGSVYFPFYLMDFFWCFPYEFSFRKTKTYFYIFRILPLAVLFAAITFKYFYVYNNLHNLFMLLKVISFSNYLFGGALVIGLVSLFLNYVKLKDKRERTPIFVILFSYTIGVLAIIYGTFFANIFTESIFNNPEYFAPVILVALLPISFSYSIFKYSLMDVSDVVKTTIIYGAATIAVASIYFFAIYFIGQTVSSAFQTEYQGFVAGFVFILFALIFQSAKNNFQQIITKKFYPEQFAYQKVLIDFSNELSGIVGLDNLLEKVHTTFISSLKINVFGIAIKDENKHNFQILKSSGLYFLKEIPVKEDILLEYIQKKKNFNQPPAISKHQFSEIFTDAEKLLAAEPVFTIIPLVINNKIVGLFLFGLKYSGAQFSGSDLELLSATASQISVSLENARLYEAETQKIKLERDLENARKIQQNLLPNNIPNFRNFDVAGTMLPAMHIGGDYYDLIKLDESRLLAVIGDVSGKGLPASFYMSKLQTMVRIYAKTNHSPKKILEEINRNIFGEIDRNTFITASIALFDTYSGHIKYCRAGHTEAIVSEKESNAYFLKAKGIGIGLEKGEIFEASLEEITLPLKPKTSILFYSDGITEAMNKNNELYSEERLLDSFNRASAKTSQQIIESIISDAKKFAFPAEQNDDITVVAVKYQ
ncbi:MAG: SpoIIE family protein phosphatase [Ignavibacteria bacterium]|nr:SpoIIE family protein phosphatase [Ignavibacteria bacterium]